MTRTRAHQTSHSRFLLRAPLALVSPPSLPRLVSPSTSRPRSLPSARVGNLHRRIHPATSSSPKRRAPPPSSLAPPHRAFTRSLDARVGRFDVDVDPIRPASDPSNRAPRILPSFVRSFGPSLLRALGRVAVPSTESTSASTRRALASVVDSIGIQSIPSNPSDAARASRRVATRPYHAHMVFAHASLRRISTWTMYIIHLGGCLSRSPFPGGTRVCLQTTGRDS